MPPDLKKCRLAQGNEREKLSQPPHTFASFGIDPSKIWIQSESVSFSREFCKILLRKSGGRTDQDVLCVSNGR